MATRKFDFYRLRTGVSNMDLYTITDSPAWQDILKKAKEGKLGNIPGTHSPITAEMKYTEEMLTETWVDATDDEGLIDTDDKAFAKFILMGLKHFAAVPSHEETDASKAVPKYMAYFRTVVDKNSPKDLLEELEAELTYKLSPEARREALEAKRTNSKAPTTK